MDTKNNKPHWKLNVFDIIIITFVILAAGALIFAWRFSGNSGGTSLDRQPVHYVIELSGMVGDTADTISEGDTIYDNAKKMIMGTVVSVTLGPTFKATPNLETGDIVRSEVPDEVTALVELVCEAASTDSEITAESGYVISIGSEVQAIGPGYAGLGYVVAIDRGDS